MTWFMKIAKRPNFVPLEVFFATKNFLHSPSFNIFSFSLSYVFSIFTDRFFPLLRSRMLKKFSLNSSMLQWLSMFSAVGVSHRLNVLCNVVESLSHVSPAQLIASTSTRSVNILSALWTKKLCWSETEIISSSASSFSWRTLECRKNKRPKIRSD